MSAQEEKKAARPAVRLERILFRVDHAVAWLSAVVLVLYIVSGFGMTRPDETLARTGGIMTQARAYAIHDALYAPLLATFVFHTLVGLRRVHLRAKRRRVVGWLVGIASALVLAYLILLAV